MRFNDKEMTFFAQTTKPHLEGRLQYFNPMANKTGFVERYFKLIGNLLFYFRLNDLGTAVDYSKVAGVIVLENCIVEPDSDCLNSHAFSFNILFLHGESQFCKHIFTTRTESDVEKWVNSIKNCSMRHWKSVVGCMTDRIHELNQRHAELMKVNTAGPPQTAFSNFNPFNYPVDEANRNSGENDLIKF